MKPNFCEMCNTVVVVVVVIACCAFHNVKCRVVSSEASSDLDIIRSCNKTSPISLHGMNTVLVHRKFHKDTNSQFKCFLHCLYTKYNWMDDEGGFLLANMKQVLEETDLDELTIDWVIFRCSAMDSMDKCERAYKFTECFWAETKEKPDNPESTFYNVEGH